MYKELKITIRSLIIFNEKQEEEDTMNAQELQMLLTKMKESNLGIITKESIDNFTGSWQELQEMIWINQE